MHLISEAITAGSLEALSEQQKRDLFVDTNEAAMAGAQSGEGNRKQRRAAAAIARKQGRRAPAEA